MTNEEFIKLFKEMQNANAKDLREIKKLDKEIKKKVKSILSVF